MMLGGLAAVYQASVLYGLLFDPFSFQQDGLAAPKVDVGRGEVGDGLVVSQVVVVGDEGGDLGLEIAGQIVVLQQDPVLECLMPALDLALGLGMEGSTDIRVTASTAHGPHLQRSASSRPPANRKENHNRSSVFTQPGSKCDMVGRRKN